MNKKPLSHGLMSRLEQRQHFLEGQEEKERWERGGGDCEHHERLSKTQRKLKKEERGKSWGTSKNLSPARPRWLLLAGRRRGGARRTKEER